MYCTFSCTSALQGFRKRCKLNSTHRRNARRSVVYQRSQTTSDLCASCLPACCMPFPLQLEGYGKSPFIIYHRIPLTKAHEVAGLSAPQDSPANRVSDSPPLPYIMQTHTHVPMYNFYIACYNDSHRCSRSRGWIRGTHLLTHADLQIL